MPAPTDSFDALVIGAGLAGLTCARLLTDAGRRVALVEASDDVGGRMRTDEVEGFRLDRGFQVYLSSYPEPQRVVDLAALGLRAFEPGACVRIDGGFDRVGDPFRDPASSVKTLLAPIGSFVDKLRVAAMRRSVMMGTVDDLFDRPETTALDAFAHTYGFSPDLIDRFLRPFFGGVTLDPTLATSSRFVEFVYRMFSTGDAMLPREGMGAIPRQMAARLPEGTVRLGARVDRIDGQTVTLATGEALTAPALVVATDALEAERLARAATTTAHVGEHCLYFAAPVSPVGGPILVLNAETSGPGAGPVSTLACLTDVQPSYSPDGRALVSVVALGQPMDRDADALQAEVRAQLRAWYGPSVEAWQHLRTYAIPYGLPDQRPPFLDVRDKGVVVREGLYRAGDHVETGSTNGAVRTGRLAAEAILAA